MEIAKELTLEQTVVLDNLIEIREIINKAIELVIFESKEKGIIHLKQAEKLIAGCSELTK